MMFSKKIGVPDLNWGCAVVLCWRGKYPPYSCLADPITTERLELFGPLLNNAKMFGISKLSRGYVFGGADNIYLTRAAGRIL
jgi:hypothetical protein